MIRKTFLALALLTSSVVLLNSSSIAFAKDTWKNVDRIVAIGDLHGDYEQYRRVMTMAQLIDDQGKWIGGKTHLVQTGDIPDRGPDSLKIIRDLQALKKSAKKSKGFVHLLIGNHEAMNIYGDLRYVDPGEYKILVTAKSPELQKHYFQRFIEHMNSHGTESPIDDAFKTTWRESYPLGYVEHRQLWQPAGEMAKWVTKNKSVIKINDVLFVHGGINPHEPLQSLKKMNQTISADLKKTPLPDGTLAESNKGPLWYRGLAQNPEATERVAMEKMLAYYGAKHIVMGHTPTRGVINPRFASQAIIVDVGLAKHYGAGLAALLIEDDELFAIHRGSKVPLPKTDADLITYLKTIATLEPNSATMLKIIDQLRELNKPAANSATKSATTADQTP